MDTKTNIKKSIKLPYQTPQTVVDGIDMLHHLLQTSVPISDDDKLGEWDGDTKETHSDFGNLW